MTDKRNFKRRVRERQLRTGERYTTARRRLLAERAEAPPEVVPAPQDPAPAGRGALPGAEAPSDAVPASPPVTRPGSVPVPVIELLDVSDEASRLGLRCRVAIFPSLAERAEPTSVLIRLRDVLVGTVGDPSTALLCSAALMGQRPPPLRRVDRDLEALRRFLRRSRAGLGGTTEDGAMLVFHVAGRDGIVPVLCRLLRHDGSLVLMTVDSTDVELRDQLEVPLVAVQTGSAPEPSLFLIHRGRSYPVRADGLVIGCGHEPTELAIGGAAGVPRHAAVIHRNGTYFLKQLEAPEGILYKGMRIDNKRIDEGDVFHIGDHEIRFTYRADG